ncbi:MAG: hypothetical protein U0869_07750 [Chloroflexota bacterium]
MSDGWQRARLGEVTRQVRERHVPNATTRYRLLGVRGKGLGAFEREDLLGSQTKAVALTPVRQGQFIYNRLFAGTGSFGVITPDLDGAWVSSEFPLFDVDTGRVDVGYLRLVFQQPAVWDLVAAACVGTTGSRMRWHERKFAEFEIDLPPLAEQRRIVDLIAVTDGQVRAAEDATRAAERALGAHLDATFAELEDCPMRMMGSLVSAGSGPSWAASDEVPTPTEGSTPVIGITSTPAGTRLVDVAQRRHVVGLSAKVRTLTQGSLVMIRTNGNRDRIGNVYRVPEAAVGHAFSAFQIGLSVNDAEDTPYLFWFLSAPSTQARISDAASGSTGLGNVAVSWLNRLDVPWPTDSIRHRVTIIADALDATSLAAHAVASRAARLRAALVPHLLSAGHHIPESYDRFLDTVA